MVRWEPGQGRGGSARSFGRRTQVTQVEGQELGSRTGSYRVGDAPQEHAHQRVGGPEHLHFLLHEMLLLGFGGKAESWAGASSSRGCGGGRDGGGRHSLPRTRARGSGSRPRLRSPTRKRCSPAQQSRDRRPARRRADGAGRGQRGWLRPASTARLSPGAGARGDAGSALPGAVQTVLLSGSVQFLVSKVYPETNAKGESPCRVQTGFKLAIPLSHPHTKCGYYGGVG